MGGEKIQEVDDPLSSQTDLPRVILVLVIHGIFVDHFRALRHIARVEHQQPGVPGKTALAGDFVDQPDHEYPRFDGCGH